MRFGRFPQAIVLTALLSASSGAQTCQPEWQPTFGGAAGMNNEVWALAGFDDGSGMALYAGGEFVFAGGNPSSYISRWDGTNWTEVGGGMNSWVRDLLVFDDGSGPALYAAGNFNEAGGAPMGGTVARWDGTTWSPLAGGAPNLTVYTLAEFDGYLYAGGTFNSAGGTAVTNIARWDGTTWSEAGVIFDDVYALEVFDEGNGPELYAGGCIVWTGTESANNIVKWDGSSWVPVGTGTNREIFALEVFDDGNGAKLFAGGEAGVHVWDGTNWPGVAGWSASSSQGVDVCALRTIDLGNGPSLYAMGSFTSVPGGQALRIARWDGTAWSALGQGLNYFHIFADLLEYDDGSGPVLIAGGWFTAAGGIPSQYVAEWDGTDWSPIGPSGLSSAVESLGTFDDGNGERLYVGGAFTHAGVQELNHLARWDGNAWTSLNADLVDGSGRPSIHDMQVFAGELYVGGDFDQIGGLTTGGIASWDGASFSPVGGGVTGRVLALELFNDGGGTDLYAAGYFGIAGGMPVGRIARWDGTAWSALGAGLAGSFVNHVNDLVVHDDGNGPALYAGGDFTLAGGQTANRIAKWDGADWSPLGVGMTNDVRCLESYGGDLYAGGWFWQAGGQNIQGFAQWDGSGWSEVGGGVDGSLTGLAVYDLGGGPLLFVAGTFSTAGGAPAAGLVAWDGSSYVPLTSSVLGGVTELLGFDDGGSAGPALFVGGTFNSSPSGDSRLARWSCPDEGWVTYCTAGTSASGCQPLISASGTASATATSGFDLIISGIEGAKDGLFFYGTNGRQANPWGSGTSYVCVIPPRWRGGLLSGSGTPGACDGGFTQDLNARWCATCPKPAHNPGPGATVQAQMWYRDPDNTSNQTSSMSGAIEFPVEP